MGSIEGVEYRFGSSVDAGGLNTAKRLWCNHWIGGLTKTGGTFAEERIVMADVCDWRRVVCAEVCDSSAGRCRRDILVRTRWDPLREKEIWVRISYVGLNSKQRFWCDCQAVD